MYFWCVCILILNFLEKRWREKKLEGSEAVILFGLTRGVFCVDVRAVHAEKDKVFGYFFSFPFSSIYVMMILVG